MNEIRHSCCLQSSLSFVPFLFEIKTTTCRGLITLAFKQQGNIINNRDRRNELLEQLFKANRKSLQVLLLLTYLTQNSIPKLMLSDVYRIIKAQE